MKRFAGQLPGAEPTPLAADASHHALRVCRLTEGARIVVFDGSGREIEATIARIDGGLAYVAAAGAPRPTPPVPPVHLVLGLPKGPAVDDAVRMATEAGVAAIHPVWAARTQGRPTRVDRWERIAVSAAAQCGRADVPPVHPPAELRAVLDRLAGVPLWIALPGSDDAEVSDPGGAVLVGPEGGWSPAEVDLALDAGARALDLGPWVLRSPTAAAVAVARLIRR